MRRFVLASPGEVRRYRRLKAVLLIPIVGAAAGFSLRPAGPSATATPAPPRPVVYTESELREDWPIEIATPADPRRALPLGAYIVEGRGPSGAEAVLFEGDDRILALPVSADGRWRGAITVKQAGTMSFRVEMRRGAVRAGRSKALVLTFVGRATEVTKEVRITSHFGGQRVKLGPIEIVGVAPPGNSIRVFADATELGQAEADASGSWRIETRLNTPGKRNLKVLDDISGKGSAPLPIIVRR